MASEDGPWLEVIGKALAYLCVQQIAQNEPKRVPDVVAKAKFLEGLGLPLDDAARVLGTTTNSIKTNMRAKAKREVKGGKAR